jgi:hypothetical protein
MNRSEAMDAECEKSGVTWRNVAALVLACGLLALCCALIIFGAEWSLVLGTAVIGFVSFVMFVSTAAVVVLPIWFFLGTSRIS